MRGAEKPCNIFPAVDDYMLEKYKMKNRMSDMKKKRIKLYELNSGKMLYLLTQYLLYNRKYHPFLLCTRAWGWFETETCL